jgi:hypothetical protein
MLDLWRWPLEGIDSSSKQSTENAALSVSPVVLLLLGAAAVDVTRWRIWFWSAMGVLGLAAVVLLIWRVPQALYDYVPDANAKERAGAEATTRTGMFAGLAGVAALVGLIFTARTYRVTQRGHLTDRYTKAIDQLGSEALDVRLGGIYALEQLAHDSDRDIDRKTIVEVLSAFVREHSNPIYRLRRHLEWLGEQKIRIPTVEKRAAEKHVCKYPLPNDVQAAVTVLGRLPPVMNADLSGAYLRKVSLESKSRLIRALLHPVLDDKADLREAKLVEVDLHEADLHEANLAKAKVMRANLTQAWLAGANLTEAHLTRANLTDARFVGVQVDGVWYGPVEAHKKKIAFSDEDLVCANLTKADLTKVNFTRADLTSVDLRSTEGLEQKQIKKAYGNRSTKLPEGLTHPQSWDSS